ncbi:MAG: flagellar protein FlgN [Lachnospiraceae bacterium]|nr:flagellar protein FlgN [Lachnospiraceae bacterium]
MASLMEELIAVLSSERDIYQNLIPVSEKKTTVLVKGDLKELQKVTEEEQRLLDQVYAIDKRREKIIANMGVVLNKDPKELDLTTLAKLMGKQPEEKKQLSQLHDSLRQVMKCLVAANEKNKELIENSLEMIEFNVNFIQSTRMSPGSNNYNRNASNSYDVDMGPGAFDAKQ